MNTLPIEGARLRKLEFWGDGKRNSVIIEVVDAPKAIIAVDQGRMVLTLATGLSVQTFAEDDSTVVFRVEPSPEQHIVLERAECFYPGDEEDWRREMAAFRSRSFPWECGEVVSGLTIELGRAAE